MPHREQYANMCRKEATETWFFLFVSLQNDYCHALFAQKNKAIIHTPTKKGLSTTVRKNFSTGKLIFMYQ